MVNYLALTGTLEQDPEVRYLGEHHDQPQASFPLAFETGHDRTGRIQVICWNRLAQLVGRYLHRGARVTVAGVLDQQQGESAGEQERNGFRLMVRSLELIETDCWGNPVATPLRTYLSGHQVSGSKLQDDLSKGSD